MYCVDIDACMFCILKLMTKMTQKTKTYCVINYGVSFRNFWQSKASPCCQLIVETIQDVAGRLVVQSASLLNNHQKKANIKNIVSPY